MEGSIAMNGGDGPKSYFKNSYFQGGASVLAKDFLIKSVQQYFTKQMIFNASNGRVLRIADLGCSVGPTTFISVQTIVEAVQDKFKILGLESITPEFQVFFNDLIRNDFNTLFRNLPTPRQYMAAGVPGSFHGMLFPKASLEFIHSSCAIHWLSKIPEEVTTKGSVAWNKGNISYAGSSSQEVFEAYKAQFSKDMDVFFRARSLELVENGLLVIVIPCRPDETHSCGTFELHVLNWVGYVLYDMAKVGEVSEALVDSFNLPVYFPSHSEVKEAISRNHSLSIEVFENVCNPKQFMPDQAQNSSLHIRAATEGMLCKHFGSGINIDDLFARYTKKFEELSKEPFYADMKHLDYMFALISKRDKVY
ncbi:hypothetical protein ACFE04_017415 [Oxalis oulophora]